ncbi:hypothetical protein [Nonomuraea dietziae]|uniref:hypothetical protein n=1 Tax=Nonomuraea dietziae TaxID=65515 RepID=UPI0031DF57C5
MLLAITVAVLFLTPTPAAADPAQTGVWPLPGQPRILRPFNPPPVNHGAQATAAWTSPPSPSTTVLAPGPGTVTYAAPLAGRGVVSPCSTQAGLRTTYLPVQASVRRGQTRSPQATGYWASSRRSLAT